jgi:hypothetical protein
MAVGRGFLCVSLCLACSSGDGTSGDAGGDVQYGHRPIEGGAAAYDASNDVLKTPQNRMSAHLGVVLSAPHIRAIYIGVPVTYDNYLAWLVTSTDYWPILAQYGVGYGSFDGNTQIDTAAFFTAGMVDSNGVVNYAVLNTRIHQVLHPSTIDAGAPDASDDAGAIDAGVLPSIPEADAYVIFLPEKINVDLGSGMTCQNALGYHDYDGQEPYAIIPACGAFNVTVSHELAEMVTDPLPGEGWYSDTDALGEIGDLCNFVITTPSGHAATALWSNKDGDCEPP